MNILLLGAGGFVGSHLVEHLVARGEHDVVGLDVADDKLPPLAGHRFQFHRADIRKEPDLVDDLIRQADVVVDLIAYANPSMYVTSPLEVFDLNFMENLAIAKRCIAHGRRLIQYSSAEVYGKAGAGSRCCETDTDSIFGPVDRPRWIYATAKLLLERVLYAHGAEGHLDFTIVRPFNFIGPRIDYLVGPSTVGGPRVFPHFMSALLTGGPMRLVNGGHVHRAFLHISDANEAFQTVLDHPEETRNQIYNVGNPANDVTIRQLAALMLDLYEDCTGVASTCALEDISGEQFYGEGYDDADRLPPDVSRLKALGWAPRRDLITTLRDTMEYYLAEDDRLTRTLPRRAGAAAAATA